MLMEKTIRQGKNVIHYLFTDWTAKRIIVLLLLAVISEYILTDLQTTSLSVEGMKKMVMSANLSGAMAIPGMLEGTIWLETDHLLDIATSIAILMGISVVLILLKKKQYIRNLFILYNLFLLVWIVFNVILMVASLWSRQGTALLHLLDAALIWFFCILSFGIFYWVIDAELQQVFSTDPGVKINFLFPQSTNRLKGWEHWTPALIDYLFVSFTFSTSFGPTDTQVLSVKGKLLVMCQATISLVIIVTIAAWAISNI
jgi:hypothetical protein